MEVETCGAGAGPKDTRGPSGCLVACPGNGRKQQTERAPPARSLPLSRWLENHARGQISFALVNPLLMARTRDPLRDFKSEHLYRDTGHLRSPRTGKWSWASGGLGAEIGSH